ncbi:uncharacterized protein LOC124885728 [Capsicum annuum]|uniref:uncharacterized protein LOC124885728 n=1 Tax=Capsicum annuum TaxID=4072 RepID=UPI001FB0EB94|nr:uncharacterized protein LOC124885728 [Capsicum annuum]
MAKLLKGVEATNTGVAEVKNDLSLINQLVDLHSTSTKQLEQQISQLSTIFNQRKIGTLPSDTSDEFKHEKNKEKEVVEKTLPKPPPPFSQRLKKKTDDTKFIKFITMLKQLTINVPLVKALEKIPGYAKFMKDLLTKKKAASYEPTNNFHHCSAIATRSLVQKKAYLGAFTIPCTVGSLNFAKDLCDLRASINLMSLTIYKKLGLRDPTPTNIRLVIVDRSVK